jgi:hypothetical protein
MTPTLSAPSLPPNDPAFAADIADAMKQVRIGEVRNAISIIGAVTAARVSRAMPAYSDVLQMSMPVRRVLVATTLKVIAKELDRVADGLLKSDAPLPASGPAK